MMMMMMMMMMMVMMKKKKKKNDKNVKKRKNKKNTLPSHLLLPISLYPGLQVHRNVPGMLKHRRSPSQSWPDGPRPIWHSLMSNINMENCPIPAHKY
ncbi:hypothetical protein ElyMa_000655100 [Elysia marginata]|uniref:Secreted protein n=1 Tax=Elysia marginata TaxID=1093978 RepID=A0AAV4GEL0_9GAST|nr:hypothetical protein ElyMa_000655100 [Elysia marginata]